MLSWIETEWEMLPSLPVTITVYGPVEVPDLTVRIEKLVPPDVTGGIKTEKLSVGADPDVTVPPIEMVALRETFAA